MNKVEDLIGKRVKVTKLESVNYKDGHPNGIDEGYTVVGELLGVKKGWILEVEGDNNYYFHTSNIIKIEGNLVYTLNSVYKVEEV